jgi:predicted ATP-dependent serine protease
MKVSRSGARGVLVEIQRIADENAGTNPTLSESDFARLVLAKLLGCLEARVPSREWNQVDIFRARKEKGGK